MHDGHAALVTLAAATGVAPYRQLRRHQSWLQPQCLRLLARQVALFVGAQQVNAPDLLQIHPHPVARSNIATGRTAPH